MDILARSGELAPTDDRAIVRDNRPLGYPTLSTLICVASLSSPTLDVHYGEFEHPGQWNSVSLADETAIREIRQAGHRSGSPPASRRVVASRAMPSITARCVFGAPSRWKCPNAGTRMFVAPSSALPSGMCGSYRAEDRHDAAVDRGLPAEHHDRLVVGQERPDAGIGEHEPGAARSRERRADGHEPAQAEGRGDRRWRHPARSRSPQHRRRRPPLAASIAAAAAAPEVTSRCLPMSPPLLCATSTRPAAGAGVAASVRPRRSEVSATSRRLMPRPCTTLTRCPALLSASPSGPQERPVLVHAGKQDDLGQLVRALVPARGAGRWRPIAHGGCRMAACRRAA